MGIGQVLQLNVIATQTIGGTLSSIPNPLINYTSSDNSIATVDSNGKVAFFNTGTVNITATLGFNNGLENIPTSNIAITVVLEPLNNYTVDFVDAIGGYIVLNSTRTFVGNRKNNGVDEPNSQFDFEVISGTTPTDKYNLTMIQAVQLNV